jgi:hypothetical protein
MIIHCVFLLQSRNDCYQNTNSLSFQLKRGICRWTSSTILFTLKKIAPFLLCQSFHLYVYIKMYPMFFSRFLKSKNNQVVAASLPGDPFCGESWRSLFFLEFAHELLVLGKIWKLFRDLSSNQNILWKHSIKSMYGCKTSSFFLY